MGMNQVEYFNRCLSLVEESCQTKPGMHPQPTHLEAVERLLIEWAENHDDMSIKGVMADLEFLYKESFGEIARKEWAAGQD